MWYSAKQYSSVRYFEEHEDRVRERKRREIGWKMAVEDREDLSFFYSLLILTSLSFISLSSFCFIHNSSLHPTPPLSPPPLSFLSFPHIRSSRLIAVAIYRSSSPIGPLRLGLRSVRYFPPPHRDVGIHGLGSRYSSSNISSLLAYSVALI